LLLAGGVGLVKYTCRNLFPLVLGGVIGAGVAFAYNPEIKDGVETIKNEWRYEAEMIIDKNLGRDSKIGNMASDGLDYLILGDESEEPIDILKNGALVEK